MVRTVTAAAIYCRISADRSGEALGVKGQEQLCRDLCARKGWPVAEVYVDNDVSAYAGKPRPAYDRMLADLEAGARDAVVCVDLDRLTRRPAELEAFIELADRHGVALANVSGDTDLATSDGRFKARIMGAVARQESEKKADRLRRQKAQAAKDGKANGGARPYGYAADGVTVREDEAAVLRDCAAQFLDGESLTALARDLNRRGVPTVKGGKWTARTLGHILRLPRLAGLRVHHGEVVGDAAWPAIIDRETHERLKASLAPKRRAGRPPATLLAGIAVCGRCSTPQEDVWNPMWSAWIVSHGNKAHRYRCPADSGHGGCGKVAVSAERLEGEVRDRIVARLAGPGLANALEDAASNDAEQRQAAETLAACERELDDLADMLGDGTIDRRGYTRARERIEKRASAAQHVLQRNGRTRVLAGLPADKQALRALWDAADVDWRRALVRAVVERVIVAPAARRGPFDAERVRVAWRA